MNHKYIFVCMEKCSGLNCKFIMEEYLQLEPEVLKRYSQNLKNVCIQNKDTHCEWEFKKEKTV